MRNERRIISLAALIVIIGIFWFLIAWFGDAVEREYKKIDIQDIRLLMTRDEVEKLHGKGGGSEIGMFWLRNGFCVS
ncbi:hypothetical protein AMS62_21210 [Bacillus sp. FJAT-18019]|nr:hypothetical protein AMS62_21210 [Bacillus sp. FJAT-18019]